MNTAEVAPFAGAWIEISGSSSIQINGKVAPFAGAWIEIIAKCRLYSPVLVAPFAGAWIEISFFEAINVASPPSLPSRERGLKLSGTKTENKEEVSLPSRERGLKFSIRR